jgi:hypothetical protein
MDDTELWTIVERSGGDEAEVYERYPRLAAKFG